MPTENAPLSVSTIDYHTAGEPFRIVNRGVGPIPGKSVMDRRAWAIENLDRVRQFLVYEPRGHADMYGCFVTEPDDADGDLGVLFFHNAGFSTACGHGTIGTREAVLRTLLRIIDSIGSYLVAFVVVLVSGKNQRLGDMVAKTLVVRA